jgi:hypothetical protein
MKKNKVRKALTSLFRKTKNATAGWVFAQLIGFVLILILQRPLEKFLASIGKIFFGSEGIPLIGEIAFAILVIFLLVIQISGILLGRNTSLKQVMMVIGLSLCYCILRFTSIHLAFLRFSFFDSLAYLDILIAFGGVSIIKLATHLRENRQLERKIKEPVSEISDVPIASLKEDKFNRKDLVNELGERLLGIKNNQVFSIGINGRWGDGKSSILNLLKRRLAKEENVVILEFNPWESLRPGTIFADFVARLTESLSEYSQELPAATTSYLKAIGAIAEKGIGIGFMENLGHLLNRPVTARGEFLEVEKTIARTGKKVVVLVDDIDRLELEEMIETFRVIRILGNFRNLSFVATYDKEYAITMLKKTYEDRAEEYLEKVFHEEISIPPLKAKEFWAYFRATLENTFSSDPAIWEEIRKGLDYRDFYALFGASDSVDINQSIHRLIGTARDAKRLATNFASIVFKLGKEVDAFDVLLLYVLQLKSYQCYAIIREGKVFKDKDDQLLKLDQSFLGPTLDCMDHSHREAAKSIFNFLFPITEENKKDAQELRRIYHRRNLELVFNRSFRNTISREEFESYLNSDNISFQKYLQNNLAQERSQEIEMFMQLNSPDPSWPEEKFGNYLSSIFMLIGYEKTALLNDFLSLIENHGENSFEKFFQDQNHISTIILNCIEKSRSAVNIPHYFLGNVIRAKIYMRADYLIGKDQALEICERALRRYLEKIVSVDDHAMNLFYNCVEDIDRGTSRIKLSSSACKTLNQFITKYPDIYLSTLLRPRMTPDDGYSLCHEPFLWSIFDVRDEFMKILQNWKPDPSEKIRNFLDIVAESGGNYHHFRSPEERKKYFPIE